MPFPGQRTDWRHADGLLRPSLLSFAYFPATFLHNGADISGSSDNNVTRCSAGTSGVDTLNNAADRTKIVKFLLPTTPLLRRS